MQTSKLLVEKSNHTATLILNRPEVHNAFDDELIELIIQSLNEVDTDNSIRVVILKSCGKTFSAGADLKWMQSMVAYTKAENIEDAMRFGKLLQTLNSLSKPTIALIQGAAYGGAVGLVACCDIAIAAENASFCLSETKIGLIPAVISPYVINAIGEKQARYYFLTADSFDAHRAYNINLVHKVVPIESLEEAARYVVNTLMKNSPQALKAAKDLIEKVTTHKLDENLIEDTVERIAEIRISSEGQEGLKAFLEKRKPYWIQDDN